jgi:steroid delta-isomerase-like uncharacterized protein
MSAEDNRAQIRRGFEALNERNWTAFDALVAPEFVFHNASTTMQGFEAYRQFILMYFTAFPDSHFTIEDLIAEGDTVVVRYTARGTHQGNLMAIPPTGKQVSVTAIGIFRIGNGIAVEEWVNMDDLGLLQQLGVIPTMG